MNTGTKEGEAMGSAGPKIEVTSGGPYFVTGNVPLARRTMECDPDGNARGWLPETRIVEEGSYALCRCGQSGDKPFCDGTHVEVCFDGAETASRKPYLERAEKTEGPALDLTDAADLCVHAGFCRQAAGTWDLVERSDDPEARKTAIQQAGDCPCGRLVAYDKAGNAMEPRFDPSIEIIEDSAAGGRGPIWVRGGIPVQSADGSTYEVRNRVTLCRCGKSSNKPFCDGRHVEE